MQRIFLVKKMCPKSPEFEEKSGLIPLVDDCQCGPSPLGFWYHQKSLDKIDLLLLLCNFQTSQEKVIEFKVILFFSLKINLIFFLNDFFTKNSNVKPILIRIVLQWG